MIKSGLDFVITEDLDTNSVDKKNEILLKSILQKLQMSGKIMKLYFEKFFVNSSKLSKILKHGKKQLLKNPFVLSKKTMTIKVHYDMYHGYGELDKAIEHLMIKIERDLEIL